MAPNANELPSTTINNQPTLTLSWIPGLSPKLRFDYKKAGYKPVFKSNDNLKIILTSNNKPKLPPNSHPRVFKIGCSCKRPYIGETKKKICTPGDQHNINTLDGSIEKSAITAHSINCTGQIEWENVKTNKVTPNRINRKVREVPEIQHQECGPSKRGIKLDDGQYATTKFWTPFFKYLRKQLILLGM